MRLKSIAVGALLMALGWGACVHAQNGSNIDYTALGLPAPYPFVWNFDESAPIKTPTASGIKGLLVPHHMIVSDKVFEAYRSFAQSFTVKPKTIIIIGPNHYEIGGANILTNSIGYKTKFGVLEADTEAESTLGLTVNNFPFYKEHSISAHVNFIKYFFPDAKIVPIILKWKTTRKELNELFRKIVALKGNTAIIASIDFSHYQAEKVASFHDVLSQNEIERCDANAVNKLEIDSHASLYLFLKLMKNWGTCGSDILYHTNSQEFTDEPLAATTSHFIALFGAGKSTPPYKISGLYTVIHRLTAKLAGDEGRFFMGSDRVFLKQEDEIYEVDKANLSIGREIQSSSIVGAVNEGENLCKGRDFGIIKGEMAVRCF